MFRIKNSRGSTIGKTNNLSTQIPQSRKPQVNRKIPQQNQQCNRNALKPLSRKQIQNNTKISFRQKSRLGNRIQNKVVLQPLKKEEVQEITKKNQKQEENNQISNLLGDIEKEKIDLQINKQQQIQKIQSQPEEMILLNQIQTLKLKLQEKNTQIRLNKNEQMKISIEQEEEKKRIKEDERKRKKEQQERQEKERQEQARIQIEKIMKRRAERERQKKKKMELEKKREEEIKNIEDRLSNKNQEDILGGMMYTNDPLAHFQFSDLIMDAQINKILKTSFAHFPNGQAIQTQKEELSRINDSYSMIRDDERNILRNGLQNYRIGIFNRIGQMIVTAQRDGFHSQNFSIVEQDSRIKNSHQGFELTRGLPQTKTKHFVKQIVIQQQEDCAICLDTLPRRAKAGQLPCGHCFHFDCLEEWLQGNANCPSCRHNLKFPQSNPR